MKKLNALVGAYMTLLVVGTLLLTACAQSANTNAQNVQQQPSHKMSIVCTSFPAYDLSRQIVGENNEHFELSCLTDNGVDLHSYQPSVGDMAALSQADLFIYVGGESDAWARDIAAQREAAGLSSLSLLDAIGSAAVTEETVEGMMHEHDEADEQHDEHHNSDHDTEYDEHVWLSLKNAQSIVQKIADAVCSLDPDEQDSYEKAADTYIQKLSDLDKQYRDKLSTATQTTLVFADRFPFRYLVDDYGLNYYAAFPGCSAETEASFETVSFLSHKLDELGAGSVLVLEKSDHALARTIIDNSKNTNRHILEIDSLQSVSRADIEAGKSYLDTMKRNLDVLIDALS